MLWAKRNAKSTALSSVMSGEVGSITESHPALRFGWRKGKLVARGDGKRLGFVLGRPGCDTVGERGVEV